MNMKNQIVYICEKRTIKKRQRFKIDDISLI